MIPSGSPGKAFVPTATGQIPACEQITLEPELEEALKNATDAEMCDIAGQRFYDDKVVILTFDHFACDVVIIRHQHQTLLGTHLIVQYASVATRSTSRMIDISCVVFVVVYFTSKPFFDSLEACLPLLHIIILHYTS